MNINQALCTSAINAEHVLAEIRDELCEALKELDSIPELQAVAGELRTRTFEMGRVTDLTALIQRVIRGARDHNERVEREKKLLLTQVGGSLDEITAFLTSEQADRTASTAESDTLNTVLTGAVEQIRLSFTQAAKPAAIRDVVDVRLVTINAQLRTVRANQEARARASEERANRLSARVQELESETLRLQRDLAEKRRLAMIDSLTSIANRVAYDERFRPSFCGGSARGSPSASWSGISTDSN
jgi:DNA-binding transcriptional MerR regulator